MKKTYGHKKPKTAKELLALNLNLLRVRNDITQEQLALGAGVSRAYLSRAESSARSVSIDILDKLAPVLEIPVAARLKDS